MANVTGNPHGASILTIIVFGLVAVPLCFSLRLWARWIAAVSFWWDDLLMGIALIGAVAIVADNIVGLQFGEGYHAEDLSHKEIEQYAQVSSPTTLSSAAYVDDTDFNKTLFAFFFLQTTTVTFIKVSLLFSYWRTFAIQRFRCATYALGAVILANAIENVLGFTFQCTPIKKFWNPMLPGHCIDQSLFITLASVFYMLTDFAIYLMPIPVIWRLQMTGRRRLEISIVFLIGGFVCLTGVARIIYTIRLDVLDLTFTNANPSIWNMVESQVGFVAANIPAMGPLFHKASNMVKKLRNTYGSQSLKQDDHTLTRHSVNNRGFERMMNVDGVGVTATAQPGSPNEEHDLEDFIPANGIIVETNLEQV